MVLATRSRVGATLLPSGQWSFHVIGQPLQRPLEQAATFGIFISSHGWLDLAQG